MVKRNIRLVLAYDGTRYHGWQRQKRDLTIQGVIEEKLRIMVQERVRLIGSGRTDAGVHALNQVCNFFTGSNIPLEGIRRGLNALLPEDIHVKSAGEADPDFHARYGVKHKTYAYWVLNRAEPDIFRRNYTWHVAVPLDRRVMADCLAILRGQNDFSAFRSAGSTAKDPVRTMMQSILDEPEEGLIRFTLEADGFLRHMVRNIVGTVVQAGMGKSDPVVFKEIFRSRDRRAAGIKAPPQGLYLTTVSY